MGRRLEKVRGMLRIGRNLTSKRGITMGFRQTAVRLGLTTGPLVGGYLWEAYGPIASFHASAIFFAMSFVLVLLLKE